MKTSVTAPSFNDRALKTTFPLLIQREIEPALFCARDRKYSVGPSGRDGHRSLAARSTAEHVNLVS